VPFFARSKLPIETLKNVWTLADQPATNTLDLQKFTIAVRLIQLLQNGTKGNGSNLAAPPGVTLRPAMFEGVSGASVPLPQQQQQQQGGGQGPPPAQQQQQQQAPLSPQQQQQMHMQPPSPPSPQRQTQPPQAAMTPPRPQMANTSPVPAYGNTALVAQDPYTLSPSEQSRYESIFAEYAKEDGFVYGQEAVALFSKSGLPQPLLAAIWNMVDTPVDNRLDKLEFAMGMHLIVCISRKQLPMPGGLPASLVHLKSQHSAAGGRSPTARQPTPTSPGSVSLGPSQQMQQQQPPPMQLGGMGSSSSMSAMTGPPMQPQLQHAAPPMQPSLGMTGSLPGGTGQAPPLQPHGGAVSISDAFEGLSTSDTPTAPSYVNAPVPTSVTFASASPSPVQAQVQAPISPPTMTMRVPSPAPEPEPVKTTAQLASSYNMGGANEEMDKLKGVLQRLQAENISLKAQLGSMTDEEKDVQRELSATVAEIGKLSNELTGMRAQVLAAKSRLLEATSDLKAVKEKKG
jgi:hypothetical protein